MSKPLTITQDTLARRAGACLAALRAGDTFAAGFHFACVDDARASMTGAGPTAERAELIVRGLRIVLKDAGLDADLRSYVL